jgi:thiamine pyrophosphate-dependent acetolactate synthase large subunit-like protein
VGGGGLLVLKYFLIFIKYINMKKCEILWKIIEKNDIRCVFGLPGSPLLPLIAHKPSTLHWINIGNELDNGFVAQSYGLFSQKTGVLIVTSGPGIGSTISSVSNATHEKYPLVVISTVEKDNGFQKWNIETIAKTVTKYTILINSRDDIEKKTEYAFYIAQTFNTGVIILVDPSIFLETTTYRNVNFNFRKLFHFDNPREIVKKINDTVNETDVLLVIGYMHKVNYDILKHFLTTNNIPFVLTWKERTMVTNKNYCGLIGTLGTHSAHYAVYHARNLVIFGNVSGRLNNAFNGAFSLNYKLKKEHIFSIVLEESDAIHNSTNIFTTDDFNGVLSHLRLNSSPSFLERLTISNPVLLAPLKPKSDLEKYCYLSSVIYKNKKLNIPVVTGVGSHWCAVGKYFVMSKPNNWLSSTEWASIGSGYFYGIGACLATRKPVWIFEGDGGTAFSSASLLYLRSNKHLPLTVIVFRDHLYSAIVSAFEITHLDNHKKNEEIFSAAPELHVDILPNCQQFYSLKEYYDYMNQYPTSKTLRFIVVNIRKRKINNSGIYAVNNHDKNYTALLRDDNLEGIRNYESQPYNYL